MAAATAAVAFPTMRDLEPRLEPFASYGGDHWPIAAGKIANRVFMIADAAQLVLAMLAAAGLAYLAFRDRLGGRLLGISRLLLLATALGLFGYQLFFLRPEMDVELRSYWDAARAGQTELAEASRAAFNDRHPTASNLMAATALAALGLSVTGAWGGTRPSMPGVKGDG